MTTMAVRYPFMFFFRITGQLPRLYERANHTEIGLSGHISTLDEDAVKKLQLKSLNRFERWLLQPIIEAEQKRRRANFLQAFIEVTGENPETDWT